MSKDMVPLHELRREEAENKELRKKVAALEAEVARLRRLVKWQTLNHKSGCYALHSWANEDDCDCGLDAARKGDE